MENGRQIAVIGVTGAGKTSVAGELAIALGAVFIDADDLHPQANFDKMRAGVPLTDVDRRPWLEAVGLAVASYGNVVLACSALRRRYRDALRAHAPDLLFVHLAPPRAVLEMRLIARAEHFMPVSLLDSQYATLEELEVDENGIEFTCDGPVDEFVADVLGWVKIQASHA